MCPGLRTSLRISWRIAHESLWIFGWSGIYEGSDSMLTSERSSSSRTQNLAVADFRHPLRFRRERPCLLETMTDREMQILGYLDQGLSNRQMAGALFVSANTVKYHLKNIYSKLAANSRLSAVHIARQVGLI